MVNNKMIHEDRSSSKERKIWISNIIGIFKNKWVRLSLLVAVLTFACIYIGKQYKSVTPLLNDLTIDRNLMIFAFLLIIIASIFGIFVWGLLMTGLGYQLKMIIVARTHVLASLAKYIPGIVWQVTGKIYLSNEAGVPAQLAGLGIGMEVGLVLASGMCIILLTAPLNQISEWNLSDSLIVVVKILGIVLSVLTLLVPWLCKVLLKNQYEKHNVHIRLKYWYAALILIIAGWGGLSGAFYFTSKAFSMSSMNFMQSALVVSGSYVAGLLMFFVPNGIVVREAVMIALLPKGFDAASGLLLSITARLQVVISELLLGLVVAVLWAVYKKHGRGSKESGSES